MMINTPSFRTGFGNGEQYLQGMQDAAAQRNMTVQLCAGTAITCERCVNVEHPLNERNHVACVHNCVLGLRYACEC